MPETCQMQLCTRPVKFNSILFAAWFGSVYFYATKVSFHVPSTGIKEGEILANKLLSAKLAKKIWEWIFNVLLSYQTLGKCLKHTRNVSVIPSINNEITFHHDSLFAVGTLPPGVLYLEIQTQIQALFTSTISQNNSRQPYMILQTIMKCKDVA